MFLNSCKKKATKEFFDNAKEWNNAQWNSYLQDWFTDEKDVRRIEYQLNMIVPFRWLFWKESARESKMAQQIWRLSKTLKMEKLKVRLDAIIFYNFALTVSETLRLRVSFQNCLKIIAAQ